MANNETANGSRPSVHPGIEPIGAAERMAADIAQAVDDKRTPLGMMPPAGYATISDMDDALRLIAVCKADMAIAFTPSDPNPVSVYVATPTGVLTRGAAYQKAMLDNMAQAYAISVLDAGLAETDKKEFSACMTAVRRVKDKAAWDRIEHVMGGVLMEGRYDIMRQRERWAEIGLTVAEHREFDRPGRYIGTPAGVYDTRSGAILSPVEGRKRHITLSTKGIIRGESFTPRRREIIAEMFPRLDETARGYFLNALAWGLNGNPARRFYSVVGAKGSGKSTAVEGIGAAVGDYGGEITRGALTYKRNAESAGLSPELLWCWRKRIAYDTEVKSGAWLNTERVKKISGGDVISARDLHEKFGREQNSVATMLLVSNYGQEPRLDSTDEGMADRYRVLDYGEEIPKGDRKADWRETLLSQEFADAVVTELAERIVGMKAPPDDIPIVTRATDAARESEIDEDALDFLTYRVMKSKGDRAFVPDIWKAAHMAANAGNDKPPKTAWDMDRKEFIGTLRTRLGLGNAESFWDSGAKANRRGWEGVALLSELEADAARAAANRICGERDCEERAEAGSDYCEGHEVPW